MRFKVDTTLVMTNGGMTILRIDVEVDGKHVAEKRVEYPAGTVGRKLFSAEGGETTICEIEIDE